MKVWFSLCIFLVGAGPAPAQVPSLATFLGRDPETRFTPMAKVEAFVREVARTSPRVRLTEYGRTAEERALVYLVVNLVVDLLYAFLDPKTRRAEPA